MRSMACFGSCPPAVNGKECLPGSTVEEGSFECCGTKLPEWVCTCGTSGVYECVQKHSPMLACMCAAPEVSTEPATAVAPTDSPGEIGKTAQPTVAGEKCPPENEDMSLQGSPCDVADSFCSYGKLCW